MAVVSEDSHGLRIGYIEVVDQSGLLLAQTLGRVEEDCGGIGGFGSSGEPRRRESQMILSIGPRYYIGNEREPVGIVERVIQLAVERLVSGAAMIAIAIDPEVREVEVVSKRPRRAECIQACTKVAEAAVHQSSTQLWRPFTHCSEQL